MKPLKNHLILFDAECPMCSTYTKVFVNSGMLDKEERTAYQDISPEACPMLDRQRAVNEIALINQETGEVTYGIESLFKVFAVAIPIFKPLFGFKPFIWLMSKAYAFISYNRRVIIPAKAAESNSQLQPTFRLDYRIAYLVFTWLLTAWILSAYVGLMKGLLPQGPLYREYLICGGQMFFQGFIISRINKNKKWDYLGNMMTISLMGALLLLPALLASTTAVLNPIFYAIWFIAVAGIMLLEHIRRSKVLALGWSLTLSWIFYRIIVFILILTIG